MEKVHRLKIPLAVAVLCFDVLTFQGPAWAQQVSDEGAELEAVVNVIRESLKQAQTNNISGFPPLKEVVISLQVMTSVVGRAGINFYVFTIGTKLESEAASTIKLAMKPPATRSAASLSAAVNPDKVKLALARAINLAKVGVINANKQEPPLQMSNIEIELKFAVKVEGSGGVKVTELLPLGVEGTGKLGRNRFHTLAVKFGT